jgi:branched-chain amino acid transport system ATP-binding protein
MLELVGLRKMFGGICAVDDVSLSLPAGKIGSIIGPNGAGKTTLFNLITGVLRPDAGETRFKGRSLAGTPMHRMASVGVGRTFQDPRVSSHMPVLANVLVGFKEQAGESILRLLLQNYRVRAQEKEYEEQARKLLEITCIKDRSAVLARDLTFAEERWLSLARMLAARPELVLLDEPSVGLDVVGVESLCQLLKKLTVEFRCTVLLIEHNMNLVTRVSDIIIVMQEGRIVTQGTPDEIRQDCRLVQTYLGEAYVT